MNRCYVIAYFKSLRFHFKRRFQVSAVILSNKSHSLTAVRKQIRRFGFFKHTFFELPKPLERHLIEMAVSEEFFIWISYHSNFEQMESPVYIFSLSRLFTLFVLISRLLFNKKEEATKFRIWKIADLMLININVISKLLFA